MAKKISKHSRAARRNEIEEPEAKSLSKLPRAESTDTTSAIIRATAKKNEDLLNNKLLKRETKDKVSKKRNSLVTNLNKDKIERALELGDRLEGKISKSKQRAKYIQTARKLNWDAINLQAKEEINSDSKVDQQQQQETEQTEQTEDSMVDDFYNDETEENTQESSSSNAMTNAFALLEEVEA